LETKFDLKAGAIVSLLIENHSKGTDMSDQMTYVISDLQLTEDGLGLITTLAGMCSSSIVLLAQTLKVDPTELWSTIITGR
jgi:flagellar biosynthesis component FlhA